MAGKTGMKHYSIDFRLMVVKDRLENGTSAAQLVVKYDLSTDRIIRTWVNWYQKNGIPKPLSNGKKKGRPKARDETLEQKVARLEMENKLLKKFHELLREEHKRK